MNDPIEITKELTIAWLGAYQTDLSVRRQKGIVPLFTPTNEEVIDFINATYARITELAANKENQTADSSDSSVKSKKKAK